MVKRIWYNTYFPVRFKSQSFFASQYFIIPQIYYQKKTIELFLKCCLATVFNWLICRSWYTPIDLKSLSLSSLICWILVTLTSWRSDTNIGKPWKISHWFNEKFFANWCEDLLSSVYGVWKKQKKNSNFLNIISWNRNKFTFIS